MAIPSPKNELFDLRSYVESEDQMLPINTIDDELMPAVLHHVSKIKSSIPLTDETEPLIQRFNGINNDLADIRDAIGKLKNTERLLNLQMKELVRLDLDDISKEMDAILEEKRSAVVAGSVSTRSEPGEISDPDDDSETSKPPIPLTQVLKELSELNETVPKLKQALNLTRKVSPSENPTSNQENPSSNQSPLQSIDGINVFTGFAKSIKTPLLSAISEFPAFEEIRTIYETLDVRLRLCLLCFSAFPDNSVINKRVLIYWWIGEGLIESLDERENTAEETANNIFQELLTKGFIEPVYKKRFPIVHRYKMHPFTRFMVVILAHRAGFFDIDSAGNFLSDSAKSRKACLVRTKEGSSQHTLRDRSESPDFKELETLFNVNESYLDLHTHWFSKLKNVKVLQLGRWQSSTKHHIEVGDTEFLKSLSSMKFLRSLSLQGISRVPELPASFSNLANLRVLDLRACHNLQKFPDGVGKLMNLTHLDLSECYLIGHMPKELASLSELQVLKGFVVVGDADSAEDACKLSKLSQLKKVRKLSIRVSGDATDTRDELFNNLPRFTALRSLTIAWVGAALPGTRRPPLLKRLVTMKPRRRGKSVAAAAAIENVVISSLRSLKKLDLRCFPWTRVAALLDSAELGSLEKLYIRGGELCDLQPIMGQTWNVEILRLKYLCKFETSWEKLRASFPRLSYLEKVGCPKLSLFPCDGTGVWMMKKSDSNQARN